MRLSRRHALGMGAALLAAPAFAEVFAGHYDIRPEKVADGVWIVRGADEAIAFANGGAIANAAILATDAGPVLFDCGPSLAYARQLSALAQRLVGKPVARVFISHLHPDHAMGAAAFDPTIVAALPATHKDLERDGNGFSDAMYRLLADWMRGTNVVLPGATATEGPLEIGGRRLRLIAAQGHSSGDLALLDEATATLITGDLVFHNRAPATPHADLAAWRASLDRLAGIPHRLLIPGHGPVSEGNAAIDQTRDWLVWLEATLRGAVADGLDMAEAGELPIPERFAEVKMARYELQRSVSHFYARYEAEAFPRIDS